MVPVSPLLGIETSGRRTGVALVAGSTVLAELEEPGLNHNEVIIAAIDRCLAAAGQTLAGVAGIGVTIGPGMFTSLRVGLSVARGLALARAIPLKGVNTLAALARSVDAPLVLSVIDARKQQVYACLYESGRPVTGQQPLAPAGLGALLAPLVRSRTVVLAGSGSDACAVALAAAGIKCEKSELVYPPARVIAGVAAGLLADEGPDDVARLMPLYLRRTDAELARERNRPEA